MFDRISNDIKEAMKAKDKVRLETLRNIKKVFLEAKTAPGANDTLTDEAATKIMQKLVKQGKDSATLYTEQGRADLAEAELAQVAVIETYLPKQMSAEELEAALKAIIAEVGAEGPKDMLDSIQAHIDTDNAFIHTEGNSNEDNNVIHF